MSQNFHDDYLDQPWNFDTFIRGAFPDVELSAEKVMSDFMSSFKKDDGPVLTPDAATVQEIDAALPDEWTQLLDERVEVLEEEMYQEVIYPLYVLDQQALNEQLEIPAGDITENARQALADLEVDIAELLEEITITQEQEISKTIPIEITQEPEHDDFGR
jgi:hypothetical protein